MGKVLGSWFYWLIAHFGFEKLGNHWTLIPRIFKYANLTFYRWGRFYFAVAKGSLRE